MLGTPYCGVSPPASVSMRSEDMTKLKCIDLDKQA